MIIKLTRTASLWLLICFATLYTAQAQTTFDPTKKAENGAVTGDEKEEANMISFGIYRALFNGEALVFYERAVTPAVGVEIGVGPTYFSIWDLVDNAVSGDHAHPYYNNDDVSTPVGYAMQGGLKYLISKNNLIGGVISLNTVYRRCNFSYPVYDIYTGAASTSVHTVNNLLVTLGAGYISPHIEYNLVVGVRSINGDYIDEKNNYQTIGALRPTILFDLRYGFRF